MKFPIFPFGIKPTLKNICLPRLLAMVKEAGFVAYLSPFRSFSLLQHSGKNTGSLAVPFSIMCQINLTKIRIWVEIIDKTSHFQKMEKGKGAALGAMMLGTAMVSPEFAAAAEKTNPDVKLAALSTTGQVKDVCLDYARGKRAEAKANGIKLSRRDQKKLVLQCQRGEIQADIAEQEKIIAKLKEHARSLDMQINENREILDKNGNILGRIIEEGGKLKIVRVNAENKLEVAKKNEQRAKVRLTKAQQKYAQKLDQFEKYLVSQR